MAKRQTRRAISVRPEVYDRLVAHCSASEQSVSGFVEEALADLSTVNIVEVQQATADAAARSRGMTHRGTSGEVAARYARLNHCSITDAARATGVNLETTRRWWHRLYPDVSADVRRRRRPRAAEPTMEIETQVLNRRPARRATPPEPPIPFWLLPTGPIRRSR